MSLVLMLALALLLAAPLAFAFLRPGAVRNRRETALALHRAQLVELQRDRDEARIFDAEYKAARLEIERRLLTADALEEAPLGGNGKFLLIVTAIALPVMGFALYLPGSTPFVPSEPHAQWAMRQAAQEAELDGLITRLRAHLAGTAPASADASQGEAYLAEALAERAGSITPEALALFRDSLAHAPAGASWVGLDEQRLSQAGQTP